MSTIIITNKRIIGFYNKYKSLDIEKINLSLIDLYESMIENLTGENNNNILTRILLDIENQTSKIDKLKDDLELNIKSNVETYKTDIDSIKTINILNNNNLLTEISIIKEKIGNLNNDIINTTITKLYEMRKTYTDDIKHLLETHDINNIQKIFEKIEKENTIMIDKTNLIINDIIPKNQLLYYNQYDNIIKGFREDMSKQLDNIKQDIRDNKTDISIEKINILISDKYTNLLNNIQQNLLNNINIIDEKLKYNIDNIKEQNNLTKYEQEKINTEYQILLNETLPKTYNKYNEIIKDLKDDLKNELKENKSDLTLDKINLLITEKYNNIQNTIQQSLNISEDKIKNTLLELKHQASLNQHNQEKLKEDINTFVNQFKISSKKGVYGENLFYNILSSLYPSSEIINTTSETSSGDFLLIRNEKPIILFENKLYETNIPKREVEKFIIDIEKQNCSGIFMSQKSGISLKQNFQIDIHHNNVLIYIHSLNFDTEKIKLAVDIIDNLTDKIKIFNNTNNKTVSSEMIELINEQYQKFIVKRESIISQINESSKKIINSIKELEINELNNLLNNYFKSSTNLLCEYCKIYNAVNEKSLSNHKRTCKKKNILTENQNVESEMKVEENKKQKTKSIKI
jgi:hypothetical protein